VAGVELIVAAMVAGATAGITDTASSTVKDAYSGLKRLLSRRLADRPDVREVLDAQETEPEVWRARLGPGLCDTGADSDEEILSAARRLLDLIATGAGQTVTQNLNVGANYGAAGTFHAPVAITNTSSVPPVSPGTD
jgi:hypothetical protein